MTILTFTAFTLFLFYVCTAVQSELCSLKNLCPGLIDRETIIDVTAPTAAFNIQGCAIGNFSLRFKSPIVVSPCILLIFCIQQSPLKKCEGLGNLKESCSRFIRTSMFKKSYLWLYSYDHHYVSEGLQCLQDFKY